ncbi:MAG: riboflavin biosynthesis protein RibF, partial [Caldilineaceae bacterium]|nr:riboflavin biosynthesis protein RibF [Caldilineaceae bacterium]
MLTFANIDQVTLPGPTCITIGNFDGLHRGHQALLQQLIKIAAQEATHRGLSAPLQSGIVTFDPHPLIVLRPDQPHWLLTTPEERLTLAAAQGVDFGVIQRFTLDLAALTAAEFVERLKKHLQLAALVVGPDFALGRGRQGDVAFLRTLGQTLDYTVHVIEPVDWQGLSVRSSRIRAALHDGDVALTATLLGRPYSVTGPVMLGDQRGRQIGIPTANIQIPSDKLLPKNGVYATRAQLHLGDKRYRFDSVANLGTRPTVDGVDRRLEVHLLDFPLLSGDDMLSTDSSSSHGPLVDAPPPNSPLLTGDLYGHQLTVEFVARLRDEQRFDGLAALVAQIHADIAHARALFAS